MKPKIFLIIPSLNKGGAERVISLLSNTLDERGYEIILVLLNYTRNSYKLNKNVRIVYLNMRGPATGLFNRIYSATRRFFKLMSLVDKEKPKLIISFITSANMWGSIAGNLFNIPYIVSERSNPDKTIGRLTTLMQKFIFILYRKANAVVLPSRGMLSGLKNVNFRQLTNVVSITNPLTEFKAFSEKKVHPRQFVLAVGRLNWVKGYDRLIDAYSQVETDRDLLIVGEGPERVRLQKQINGLGIGHKVFLAGAKDNIHDYYKQSDLFVLSSHYEGFPNVLIEAMSAGCPVIAVDCHFGPAEIIRNEENGLLIPNDDTLMLAAAIDRLLKDDRLRTRMAVNARSVLKTNSIDSVVDRWEELIASATDTSSAVVEGTNH
ncbi:MAG TPA: glycosyltransferase family 4 protein [Sphingobacteriaceae bacterium]